MASLCVYWFLLRSAVQNGKVRVSDFGLPDLMAGIVFFTWFASASLRSFSAPARAVTKEGMIGGGVFFLLIVLGICGFMKLRKISIVELFGLNRVTFWKIPLLAFGLLLGIFPLLGATGAISKHFIGPDAQPQEVVKFFQQAVQEGDSHSVLITLLIGGLLAPIAEELMFRGYFYGLCKRYIGIIAGLVLNSLLFSAMHANLAALPSLWVLAIALTLAYEITGCLLVPIAMHSLFNLTMFAVIINSPTQ